MNGYFFYPISLNTILLTLFFLFLVTTLGGYQVGVYLSKKYPQQEDASGLIPSTILGLLALILGFTLSMAVSRYDDRKRLVLKEANAIGTAYLRADLLREPYQSRTKETLKKYLDQRIQFYEVSSDLEKFDDVQKKSEELQQSMWKDVAKFSHTDDRSIVRLFIVALNDVIDISGERLFVNENHVPEIVYLIIIIIALIGLASVGYVQGVNTKHSRFGISLLALLFSVVIVLMQDLDRPTRGLIKVNQQSLYLLKSSLK